MVLFIEIGCQLPFGGEAMEGYEADFIVRCSDEANSMHVQSGLDNAGGLSNGRRAFTSCSLEWALSRPSLRRTTVSPGVDGADDNAASIVSSSKNDSGILLAALMLTI